MIRRYVLFRRDKVYVRLAPDILGTVLASSRKEAMKLATGLWSDLPDCYALEVKTFKACTKLERHNAWRQDRIFGRPSWDVLDRSAA